MRPLVVNSSSRSTLFSSTIGRIASWSSFNPLTIVTTCKCSPSLWLLGLSWTRLLLKSLIRSLITTVLHSCKKVCKYLHDTLKHCSWSSIIDYVIKVLGDRPEAGSLIFIIITYWNRNNNNNNQKQTTKSINIKVITVVTIFCNQPIISQDKCLILPLQGRKWS